MGFICCVRVVIIWVVSFYRWRTGGRRIIILSSGSWMGRTLLRAVGRIVVSSSFVIIIFRSRMVSFVFLRSFLIGRSGCSLRRDFLRIWRRILLGNTWNRYGICRWVVVGFIVMYGFVCFGVLEFYRYFSFMYSYEVVFRISSYFFSY